jgi:septin family protein
MMLPYEPLIKIVHSTVKCYNHQTKKKIKTGEIHTYTSKQYVIPLKNDQPFSCDEEVAIVRSEDYFKFDKVLQQRKQEYNDYLERNIILEREINDIKLKLENYEDLEKTIETKIQELKKELQESEAHYKTKNLELEDKLKEKTKELLDAKKEIESKEAIIKELKEEGILGKITGIFPGQKSGKKLKKDKK